MIRCFLSRFIFIVFALPAFSVGQHSEITEYSLIPFEKGEPESGSTCVLKSLTYLAEKLIEAAERIKDEKEMAEKRGFDTLMKKELCTLLNSMKDESEKKERVARPVIDGEEAKEAEEMKSPQWKEVWSKAPLFPKTIPGEKWATSISPANCHFENTGDFFKETTKKQFMDLILKKLFPEIEKSQDMWKDSFIMQYKEYVRKRSFRAFKDSFNHRVDRALTLAKECKNAMETKILNPDEKRSEAANPYQRSKLAGSSIDLYGAVDKMQQKVTMNQKEWAQFYTTSVFQTIELQSKMLSLFRDIFEPFEEMSFSKSSEMYVFKYKLLLSMQKGLKVEAAQELERFEMNFDYPNKCILSLDDDQYCIRATRWDYWVERAIILKEAMIELKYDNPNPCNMEIVDKNKNPLKEVVEKRIKKKCKAEFLAKCPKGTIADPATMECVKRSSAAAMKTVAQLRSDTASFVELSKRNRLLSKLRNMGKMMSVPTGKGDVKGGPNCIFERYEAGALSAADVKNLGIDESKSYNVKISGDHPFTKGSLKVSKHNHAHFELTKEFEENCPKQEFTIEATPQDLQDASKGESVTTKVTVEQGNDGIVKFSFNNRRRRLLRDRSKC